MISESQLHQLAKICCQAAEVEIMPRFRQLEAAQISQKINHHDLVTVADQAAETFIMEKLLAQYPNALFIGEESIHADASALDKFNDAALSFILDPIDGTWHYANGSVYFGVMLGVARYGEVIGAIILEPVTGDYLWAIKGKGAFDRVKGIDYSLKVGQGPSLPLSDTMGCFSFGVCQGVERDEALRAASQMGRVMDYRCAAAEYRLLVTGAVSFVIFQNKLNVWDHGPGQLIVSEAGAYSRLIDGQPYQPQINGKLIVAENESRWHELAALFN